MDVGSLFPELDTDRTDDFDALVTTFKNLDTQIETVIERHPMEATMQIQGYMIPDTLKRLTAAKAIYQMLRKQCLDVDAAIKRKSQQQGGV